ncbi:protein SPIRAL1-like 3 [Cicer arietinum]|uniref:Protein SPIRAL1-like 2 n=1 Tax=Cicer arietinum TaxID=3827 RepID=A0A3Q7YCH1_CICAR|nr:protein SPIRAL1-like 2 [Cicer arietinum]
MGRGVSSGGGQSSLGYLFGTGESGNNIQSANNRVQPVNGGRTQNASVASPAQPVNGGGTQNASIASPASVASLAGVGVASPSSVASLSSVGVASLSGVGRDGIPGCLKNNYHRADGQNCGNFLTDRPSTKVHAAPGGGSSLDYLFGGPPSSN